MSKKRVTETNTQKILNSDIYDITRFVDDIKKRNIDGVEDKETLMVGMGRRAVDLEHSRVGQPRLGCVLNTIAVCHVSCFLSLLRCE